jgi:hypothetical protein
MLRWARVPQEPRGKVPPAKKKFFRWNLPRSPLFRHAQMHARHRFSLHPATHIPCLDVPISTKHPPTTEFFSPAITRLSVRFRRRLPIFGTPLAKVFPSTTHVLMDPAVNRNTLKNFGNF